MFGSILTGLRGYLHVERQVRRLSELDPVLLRDIGVDPHDIRASYTELWRREQPVRVKPGAGGEGDRGLVRRLRHWLLRTGSAHDMARWNRDVLQDLGYERGDIEVVSDLLADMTVSTPTAANENRKRPRPRRAA